MGRADDGSRGSGARHDARAALGGNDSREGGVGDDRVTYGTDTPGGAGNLSAGNASDGFGGTDSLVNLTQVVGSAGDDTLIGAATNDTLLGEAGNDTLRGADGSDSLDGGAGVNNLTYDQDAAGATVNLTSLQATDGSGGTDTLANFTRVEGSANNDTLIGNDSVTETLSGGAGDDLFNITDGNDTLVGGTGNDTFVFTSNGGNVGNFDNASRLELGAETNDTIFLAGTFNVSDGTEAFIIDDLVTTGYNITGLNILNLSESPCQSIVIGEPENISNITDNENLTLVGDANDSLLLNAFGWGLNSNLPTRNPPFAAYAHGHLTAPSLVARSLRTDHSPRRSPLHAPATSCLSHAYP